MMTSPLEKPEGLNWDAASVELPPMPTIPPGADAMSMTISAVLPTLEAALTANVTAVSAKENMFSGKVGAAQSAYQNADEAGSQSVSQLGSMLGQMGQMAQTPMQAASSLGGQTGSFGSMMQQAMGSAGQGGGSGAGAAGGASGLGSLGSLGSQLAGQIPTEQGRPDDRQQQDRREQQLNDRQAQQDQRQADQDQREHQQDARQAQLDARDAVSHGGAASSPGHTGGGHAPVNEHARTSGGEDLAGRM
jgi:hypothetical protein